jgi:spore photoproduct lyase
MPASSTEPKIDRLYVDADLAELPEVAAMAERLDLSPLVLNDPKALYEEIAQAPDPIGRGKQILRLTANRGAWVRPCPGTREYTCCGYEILHVGTFCTMDCAYCILQAYFHPPILQYFVNRDVMELELGERFAQPRMGRIGTGEFTDSLIWEPWTELNPSLIRLFAGQDRCILELKTKTTTVERLLALDHREKTIMAWSLNTPRVVGGEERRTASIEARLRAAARCAAAGYPVAFHFDPMILYEGCEEEYGRVLEQLFARVPAERIVWISMGTFRFMPDLKPLVEKRFAASTIAYGEFVRGLDGKMRYFKPLRTALYREMVRRIREAAPEVCVYLCMEAEEVWEQAFGFYPGQRGGLPRILDRRAAAICGISAA